MMGPALPPEFLLTAACCRWPPSEPRNAAVRAAAVGITDWDSFLRIVRRQRVVGLAHDALPAAGIAPPPSIAEKLAAQTQKIVQKNMLLAREAFRLQRLFDAAQIPAVMLKGVAVAQLGYGSFTAKQTMDIDFLVPPERAEAAMQLLAREGYALASPAKHLSATQRRAVVHYAKDVEFMHPGTRLRVDLQWRAADNPLLLKGIDANSAAQTVALSDEIGIRTLNQDDLFAYLCVHGAYHAWSRLKWLADLNALIAASNADVVRLHRHAQGCGAGLCAGQALLLCHRLFDLQLPAALAAELQADKRMEKLAGLAMKAMLRPRAGPGGNAAAVSHSVHTQFLLGQGWPFFAAQCQVASVGILDVIALPLPPSLHFLYPFLRLPLWLWRHATSARIH